ncbi:MAG: hypothetical protein VB009_01620 [Erysipelotrichaceae bacterium]|nr:hypothetical protein [Erysipelotrichaceae bacterium]
MKKYELNPKEEVKQELIINVLNQKRKQNQILLLGIIAGIVITWFFFYVMTSIPSFYPLFLIVLLITGIGIFIYIFSFINGLKSRNNERYYITNVRVVAVNKNNEIIKEIYLSKIYRTITEKILGNTYDIIINPKEETDLKKLRKHNKSKPLYTADTMILRAVNINQVKDILVSK